MNRFIAILVVAVFCLAAAGLAQAKEILSWEPGKWTQKNRRPVPVRTEEETHVVEAQGDSVKGRLRGHAADGSRIAYGYTAKYDGRRVYTDRNGNANGADTLALKRINTNIYEVRRKRAGNVVMTAQVVVSKDGKVTTITTKGTNVSGKPDSSVRVFDKQ